MFQRLKNLFKRKSKVSSRLREQLDYDAHLSRMAQEREDRRMDRCVEQTAQDAFLQWCSNPYGIIVFKPCAYMITQYTGQTPKYTSETYNKAIKNRLAELRDAYLKENPPINVDYGYNFYKAAHQNQS